MTFIGFGGERVDGFGNGGRGRDGEGEGEMGSGRIQNSKLSIQKPGVRNPEF
jgi:hypothetical protein